MSSLRHHRVLVASLFLPTTAVLGDDPAELSATDVLSSPFISSSPPARSSLMGAAKSGPLKSIVEDLRDKVRLTSSALHLCRKTHLLMQYMRLACSRVRLLHPLPQASSL